MGQILIIDYGASNLRSVQKAVEHCGHRPLVTSDARCIADAPAVIVPGVGAAADIMRNLTDHGMVEPLRAFVRSGRPFLGVCMGMQTLFASSTENGGVTCLDILPGRVTRLPDGVKIPHMGWNTVRQRRPHYIFDGIPDDAYFYFVHSYAAESAEPDIVIGETEYGRVFPAVVAQANVVATQFHPEKSSGHGLRIYANFVRHALGAGSPK